MNIVKDLLIIASRMITILPLMLLVILWMGKRSISEIPVFDFLVIIILGTLVGADISDPKISHMHTASAVIAIALFQRIVSGIIINHRKIGSLITFKPTIIIQDGKFVVNSLRRIRYSIDNVLEMMRRQGVFDISEVHLGIIESNGKLSILKKDGKTPVTIEDTGLTKKSSSVAYPIVVDGVLYGETLKRFGLTKNWLQSQLKKLNVRNIDEVFFASINEKRELQVSTKNYKKNKNELPPIYN